MSMKLNINGSTMEITDDNKTIVSSDIAKEINDKNIYVKLYRIILLSFFH